MTRLGSVSWPCERGVNGGVNGCVENAVHTSIHTTFTAFAQRPRKLCGRRELAPKMSETGGFIEIRPGQRSRRRTARMLYNSTWAQNTLRGLLARRATPYAIPWTDFDELARSGYLRGHVCAAV